MNEFKWYVASSRFTSQGISRCLRAVAVSFVAVVLQGCSVELARDVLSPTGSSVVSGGTPVAQNTTITGTSNVVADGVTTSTITVQLRNDSNGPVSGITPTFAATDTGGTNTYAACSVSDATGNSICLLKSTKAEVKTLALLTPIAVVGDAVTFKHGPASKTVFTTEPGAAGANATYTPQPVVEVQDAFGNVVNSGPDASATITISLTGGTGALAGTLTETAVNGVANFAGNGMQSTTAGVKTLTATKRLFQNQQSSFLKPIIAQPK